jgi:hypothetical protein
MGQQEAVFRVPFGSVTVIFKVDPQKVHLDPPRKPRMVLTRAQVETVKADMAEKIRTLYGNPDAEVFVTRWYGTRFAPLGEGDLYVAKVEIVGGACFTALGHTELRALRELYRQMQRMFPAKGKGPYPKGQRKGVTRP